MCSSARSASSRSGCRTPRHSWRRKDRASWCRSEEHTSELQSRSDLVCRLLLEKKKRGIFGLYHHKLVVSGDRADGFGLFFGVGRLRTVDSVSVLVLTVETVLGGAHAVERIGG